MLSPETFAQWKYSNNVPTILDRIASYIVHQDDGKITFRSLSVYDDIATLVSLTAFSEQIPEEQKEKLMSAAISATSQRKNGWNSRTLLQEIRNQATQYVTQKPKKYVLLTSISMRDHGNITRKKIEESWITFHHTKPKRFDIAPILTRVNELIPGKLPENYIYITVSCQGRCEYTAARNALDNLDFLRGIWNFWYNQSRTYRFSSEKLEPVNKIVLGPYHSLHGKNGKLAANTFWWESSYRYPKTLLSVGTKWKQLIQYEQLVKKLIAKSHVSSFIKTALIRYVRALDESDFSTSFLKLWSVLEYVTMTGGNKYDVTIKRTLSLLKNSEYHKIILNDLKEKRNNLVHANSQLHRNYDVLQQLIGYVNSVLLFMIQHGYRFSNEEKLAEFLDMPLTKEELGTRERDVQLAKKLRGYTS